MAKPRKRRRRKEDRPGEIAQAALGVFAERGFAAANLDDVARRAGVAKGTLYLYFETKEELFRAVVRNAVKPNFDAWGAGVENFAGSFADAVPLILANAARTISESPVAAIVKMVVGESRNFPDLARIWHDEVVTRAVDMMARLIAHAQAKGEVIAGDARLYAFSLAGPMVMGALFREVFGAVSTDLPDLDRLARQHAATLLGGLLVSRPKPTNRKRKAS